MDELTQKLQETEYRLAREKTANVTLRRVLCELIALVMGCDTISEHQKDRLQTLKSKLLNRGDHDR